MEFQAEIKNERNWMVLEAEVFAMILSNLKTNTKF